MSFKCPVCGKDFGKDKTTFDKHFEIDDEHRNSLYSSFCKTGGTNKPKEVINLKSIANAIRDGRLFVFVDGNGFVIIKNTKTKNAISIESMADMYDYDDDFVLIDEIYLRDGE